MSQLAVKVVNEESKPQHKPTYRKTGLVGRARFTLKTRQGQQVIKSINSKERLLRTRVATHPCKSCKGGCK